MLFLVLMVQLGITVKWWNTLSTADKLQNLARYKLLPLKQKNKMHKPNTFMHSLLPLINQNVLRLRELLREFMLLRDLLRM